MTSHIDHIVSPTHDEKVAIFIEVTTVSRMVIAWMYAQIRLLEPFVITPNGGQTTRRQGQSNHNIALRTSLLLHVILVQNPNVKSRHWKTGRATFHRQSFDANGTRRNRPSGFRLPPVVNNRNTKNIDKPFVRRWICSFTCKE